MGNPRTRTTKTFASLIIVARAVNHIRTTGEPVTILTPSSGNKATALRDAVLRAHETGLVGSDELNIFVLVPEGSLPKMWSSPLSTSPALRRRNPLATLPTSSGSVKEVAGAAYGPAADRLRSETGRRLWCTLDLANYVGADALRAQLLHRADDGPDRRPRLHVHAVSSAYGLIGHGVVPGDPP